MTIRLTVEGETLEELLSILRAIVEDAEARLGERTSPPPFEDDPDRLKELYPDAWARYLRSTAEPRDFMMWAQHSKWGKKIPSFVHGTFYFEKLKIVHGPNIDDRLM